MMGLAIGLFCKSKITNSAAIPLQSGIAVREMDVPKE